jgi:hypothetical protein
MRLVIVSLFVFALSTAAQAEHDLPSDQALADMGLSGLRVLSDQEGLAIRGFGNGPKDREPTEKMLWYQQGLTDLRTHVAEFKGRLAGRNSNNAGRFSDNKSNFRNRVSAFRGKIGG